MWARRQGGGRPIPSLRGAEDAQAMMLLEVLVILEVQRCERYFMGEAARRDPHVVDRTRASALECCCGQAAPDGTYRLIAWQHGNAGQPSGQFLAAVGAPVADFSP